MNSKTASDRRIQALLLLTLLLNIIFLVKDVSDDIAEHAGLGHIAPELLTAMGTLALVIYFGRSLLTSTHRSRNLEMQISELRDEASRWRQKTADHVHGLADAIDAQMKEWDLTSAETQIALLLLKGLSNREIADVRATSEKTIKQQSSAVYRKAGLNGRSELFAFFLEDLLTPRELDAGRPIGHS